MVERLVDDAIALGQFQQLVDLVLRRIGVDLEDSGGWRGSRPARSCRRRSVPRKSRSPSAFTTPLRRLISSAVATAFRVTPAQATSASSSMSPEQSSAPVPPLAGCRPAIGECAARLDLAGDVLVVERSLRLQRHDRRIRLGAVLILQRRLKRAQLGRFHDAFPELPPKPGRLAVALPLRGCLHGVSEWSSAS